MSLSLSQSEREAFLADLHVGVLALPDGDRGPLAAPIWYDYEPGGDVWVLIGPESRKGKRVEVGQRVSLVAQREALPYAYVSIEGPIVSIEDSAPGELLAMAQRYLGEAQGQAYVDGASGANWTVRIKPERWLTVDYGKSV